ncbi:hypothetical protein OH77DRAFT_1387502, partial [Trametes cingulata]
GCSVKDICLALGVKKSVVYQSLEYHSKYGVSYNPLARKSGRQRTINGTLLGEILQLIKEHPTLYADEIQD